MRTTSVIYGSGKSKCNRSIRHRMRIHDIYYNVGVVAAAWTARHAEQVGCFSADEWVGGEAPASVLYRTIRTISRAHKFAANIVRNVEHKGTTESSTTTTTMARIAYFITFVPDIIFVGVCESGCFSLEQRTHFAPICVRSSGHTFALHILHTRKVCWALEHTSGAKFARVLLALTRRPNCTCNFIEIYKSTAKCADSWPNRVYI